MQASVMRTSRRLPRKEMGIMLVRSFKTGSQSAEAQAPAMTQPSTASGGSFFGFLFGKKSVPGPPMYEPLPGVPVVPSLTLTTTPIDTVVSTLPNGLKIATQDTPGPAASLGVYIDSGSTYETPANSGVSVLLERMAFKSSANRTHFRYVREVEAIGANMLSSASREQMCYSADVIRTYVPEAVELLLDTVRNPLFNEWEVQEQVATLSQQLGFLQAKNPQGLMLEALHSAGYAGALAMPLFAPSRALRYINGQALFDFVLENFSAPRMVIAATGVQHEEFKATVEPLVADLPALDPPPTPPSQYVGGEWRMAADVPLTHVALGFEIPGGWHNETDSITAVVLQMLLGGGGSFSAGGPGKGMYSRLYTRVLNDHNEVQSCTAFSMIYNRSGIIGIHATAPSSFVPKLVDILAEELTAVAQPGKVSETELSRAKNATISSVLMNLESRAITCEDIGRQILTYGERKSPQVFIDAVQSLTPKDITRLAQKVLRTPLTMAAYGDVIHVPRFDQVAARFG